MTHQIEFDLEEYTQKDLLLQICIRLDRHFPTNESEKIASELLADAKALIEGYATDLIEKGFGELGASVLEVFE